MFDSSLQAIQKLSVTNDHVPEHRGTHSMVVITSITGNLVSLVFATSCKNTNFIGQNFTNGLQRLLNLENIYKTRPEQLKSLIGRKLWNQQSLLILFWKQERAPPACLNIQDTFSLRMCLINSHTDYICLFHLYLDVVEDISSIEVEFERNNVSLF